MKIVYQGDAHLRDSVPVNRIDNYWVAQFNKLQQLVDFTDEYEAYLLLGGDLFDTYKASAELMNQTINTLKSVTWKYSVLGQHDVPYHQMHLMKSPVHILQQAEALDIVGLSGSKTLKFKEYGGGSQDITIHFCSWEQKVPEPIAGNFNILLGHISVFENKVPFYWKGEGYTANSLRKKYPDFDLYLCGDIHIPFVKDNVVVSGSMMRQSIDQIDYKPRCYLIDTETMDIKPLFYKIHTDVFSVKEDQVSEILDFDNLVKALKDSAEGKASYKRDCLALSKDDEPVKKIIQGVFDEFN